MQRACLLAVTMAVSALSAASVANAQSRADKAPYCLKMRSAATDCRFATLAACERQRAGQGGECMENPKGAENTGSAGRTRFRGR
jgi:hypothetical protein